MAKKVKPIPVVVMPQEMSETKRPPEPDRMHMSIRQIKNGFIINEHGYRDGEHYDHEFYSKTAPRVKHTRFATEQKGSPAVAPAKTPPAPASPFVGKSNFEKGPSAKELPKKLSARNRDQRLMRTKL